MKRLIQLLTFSYFLLLPLGLSAANASLHHVNFTAAELKTIQGHYSTIYGHFFIRVNGNHVSTRYDGKHIQLIKKSNGHFYPRYKFLWVFPISIGNMSFTMKKSIRRKTQILMHQNNRTHIVAQKFISKPIPQTWKRRLGTYKATRLKGAANIRKVRLGIQNGALVAFINNLKSPYPLIIHSNTQLTSPSTGQNNDRTIRISVTKNSILLNYDNNRLELKKL